MTESTQMTEESLKAHLAGLRGSMINDPDKELSQIRKDNLNAYMGESEGEDREGRSNYQPREVFEAVEWALPSLLRTFTSGDKVVVFDPFGPEDEDQAQQETDAVNHYLMKENNGYLTFYEWFKDALMYPNGYAKVYTEIKEESKTERYSGVTIEQIALFDDDERIELLAATDNEDGTFDIELKFNTKEPKLKFEAVPPEQVHIDNDHTSVSLEDCKAVCHRTERTKSYLLSAGYDADKLELVSSEEDATEEETNRRDTEDEYPDGSDETGANKQYWLEEWYLQVDYDGDGIAERRKVDYIGGQIFENIEYDYQPICSLSCMPMSHRHSGMSMAELMRPLQDLSKFFQQGINNNIASILEGKKYISEAALTDDGATLDQLLDPTSAVVVTRQPGLIEAEQHQPIIGELMQAMASLNEDKQVRSGIAPNLSLNPDILQQSTFGSFSAALEKADQRLELMNRTIAETGVKEAMIKAHRQIKEHQDKAKMLRIRGKWIETNPTDWRDRVNVTVNVGLGFNNNEKQIAVLMQMLGIQKEAMPLGLSTPENIFNSLEQLAEASGLKQAGRYFTNPADQPPQQPQEDPMVTLAKQQLEQQGQKNQADFQLKAMKDKRELDIKEGQAKNDAVLKSVQAYKTNEEAKALDMTNQGLNQDTAALQASLNNAVEQQAVLLRDDLGRVYGAQAPDGSITHLVRDDDGNIIGTQPQA